MKEEILTSIINEIKKSELFSNVISCIKGKNGLPISVLEGCESFKTAFCATIKNEITSPLLIIVPEEKQARILKETLSVFYKNVFVYPTREFIFDPIISYSKDIEQERLNIISRLKSNECDIVISVPDALMQYTIPSNLLNKSSIVLKSGEQKNISELIPLLLSMGYKQCEIIEGSGQFSLRGSILDIFSPIYDSPCRIDFFGDEIDSMGTFDVATQRRTENITEYTIIPVSEILGVNLEKVKNEVLSLISNAPSENTIKTLEKELYSIENDNAILGVDKYFSLIYPKKESIFDFLQDVCIISFDSKKLFNRIKTFQFTTNETIETLVSKGLAKFENASVIMDSSEFISKISRKTVVFDPFDLSEPIFDYKCKFVSTSTSVSYNRYEANDLFTLIGNKIEENKKILIAVRSERESTILQESLNDLGINTIPFSGKLYNKIVAVSSSIQACSLSGFANEDFVFISDRGSKNEGAYSSARKRKASFKKKSERISSFTDLEVGDIVVHTTFGIGKYLGVERIKTEKVYKDYISIQYANNDTLYVPCSNLDMVSKYIGDENVKLSKMGGSDWNKKKSKAKAAATGTAQELVKLYGMRLQRTAHAFDSDDALQTEFEDLFEYVETESQLSASDSIKKDMQSTVPMERLLCGDVGFGKTEVALRAAFKCIAGGKQVAILVPTTILALQHYNTILQRFRTFPITADYISRFKSNKEQKNTLLELAEGKIDIIVGTHRILQKDVVFKDLGLIIVDEEQRFGVKDKEKLKEMCKNVHSLSLTATPIPRTLSMAISGIRDMSVLDEAPMDRQPIQTFVLEHDDDLIFEAIRKELRRGGQVFYLHNRVETIYAKAEVLRREFPDKNIDVAHGKMNRSELSSIWQGLVEGETDILVCTTIIETGVDVPNANTLIIEDANRMGVSQLHQIRGRVGRSSRKAYAYLTYRADLNLSEIATKRLEAIREFTEFGSGFRIAMRDLELRGAGNVLGTAQSGHMDEIGYELYIKILENAVLELKGEKVKEEKDCVVSFTVDAYIPEYYIESDNIRMEIYKKIAEIDSQNSFDDLFDELLDRFGEPPKAVVNLLNIAMIRNIAKTVGVESIVQQKEFLRITLSEVDENMPPIICKAEKIAGKIFYSNNENPCFSAKLSYKEDVLSLAKYIIFLFSDFKDELNNVM